MVTKTKEEHNKDWAKLLREASVLLATAADYLDMGDSVKAAECMVELGVLLRGYGLHFG